MKYLKGALSIIFTLLLQAFFHYGLGQNHELKFNLVEGPNGKPLGKVNAIGQDPYGYMWFCGSGEHCLYRFDGNRMIGFRHDDSNPNSLGMTFLETSYVDAAGMIWIGGEGLDQFNPATGIFKHYRHDDKDPGSLAQNGVHAILKDKLGRLWVGTDNGLDRLDEKTGKFIHYRNDRGNPKSLSSNVVWRLYEDRHGVIWVETGFPWNNKDPDDGGLNRLNDDGTFTRYVHDPKDPHSLINNKVAAVLEDSRGTFWVGTGGDGLHTMDRKAGTFERHPYEPVKPEKLSRPPIYNRNDSFEIINDKITFITEDRIGSIWIGTRSSGLNRYDDATKKITHFEKSHGFPDSTSWEAFTSTDGELWIATESGNLYRTDPMYKPVTNINSTDETWGFLEDHLGNLWVGSKGGKGLFKFDQQLNLLRQFKHDPSDSSSLPDDRLGPLFQNKENEIWTETDKGIRVLNLLTQKFSRFGTDENLKDLDGNGSTNILRDKEGIMWIARWNEGGLVRYNPKDHSLGHYYSKEGDPSTISSNNVGQIMEDKEGMIWTGSDQGINRLDKKTGKFVRYLSGLGAWSLHVFQDSENNIWVGTEKGLYLYDKKENRFNPFFDGQSGMNTIPIGGMVEDDAKNLWFYSNSAIIRLDLNTKQPFIYGDKYGIFPQSMQTWKPAYRNRKGRIFIPNNRGFYTFSPEELAVRPDFKVIITDLSINGKQVSPGKASPIKNPIEGISDLDLKYDQNNIAFSFAAIDYRDPEATRYSYILEGYDSGWQEVKDKKEKGAYYFNLHIGTYTYRVRAYNTEGTMAEKAITIHINPPWWQTWWAYALYALVLMSAVWIFIRWRTRTLQKEKTVLEEKVAERTRELKKEKEIVESTLTELKSTQAQLIQSEKMASLGEMTAGIAHEIQNPLNFVNNFSDINADLIEEAIAEMGTGNMPEARELLDSIRENEKKIRTHGGRADAIVKSMLQHSRTSTGQKEATDINVLAEEYLKLSYQGLRARDKSFEVTLKTDFDTSIGKAPVVPQDIGRVLLNLYNNAFYAVSARKMNEDEGYVPTVSVRTKMVGKMIELTVGDNGSGIPAKIREKIFQPFFTTKPTGEGTGLGLSLSYDIIKAHGGDIRVESAEGEGTTIHVILPA